MKRYYDMVIIGSGFGGSITACRLAEAQKKAGKGVSVCVLERGKRYHMGEFPRNLSKPKDWWWRDGGKKGWKGLLEFRSFNDISVLVGSGIGGTTLLYLDVQIDAFKSTFDIRGPEGQRRWPSAIRGKPAEDPQGNGLENMLPYYQRVFDMLRPSPIPEPPLKTLALKAAADGAGASERFRLLNVAVYWGVDGGQKGVLNTDPYGRGGPPQIGCGFCGECFIGCNTHSKNTLDLNYLWFAAKAGAEVYSQHKVVKIELNPEDHPIHPKGYTVHYEDLRWNLSGTVSAKILIVSAGSLGSTELLLRSKHGYRNGRKKIPPTLPDLSDMLGRYFSGNGDFGAGGFETNRTTNPMTGPTITSVVDYRDKLEGHGFIIEDGGFPDILRAFLRRTSGGYASGRAWLRALKEIFNVGGSERLAKGIFKQLLNQLDFDAVRDNLLYLAMGIDAADGEMSIDEEGNLEINWNNRHSMPLFREMEKTLRELTESPRPGLDGNLMLNPTWSAQKHLITVHPLGGCPMGDDVAKGVVDADGQVFNYSNLYVVDGSIVPSALGPNPSKTIGALAERISEHIITSGIYKRGSP
jgi:cholesterol oxidase